MQELVKFVKQIWLSIQDVEVALWKVFEAVPIIGKHARLIITGLFLYGLGAYVLHWW